MDLDSGKRFPVLVAFLLGIIFLGFGKASNASTYPGQILLGAGASIIASVVLIVVAGKKEELAERVMKYGIKELFCNRLRDLDENFWTDFIASANQYVKILGVANHGYVTKSDGVVKSNEKEALKKLIEKGVTVTILWLDPMSELARIRDEEEKRGTRTDAIKSILAFHKFRESLVNKNKKNLILKIYNATPTCGLTWVDESMVVTHYLSHTSNQSSPGFVLTNSRIDRLLSRLTRDNGHAALYKMYGDNLNEISRCSLSVDDGTLRNMKALLKKLPEEKSEADLRALGDSHGHE